MIERILCLKVGEGHAEVRDQSEGFVPLSNKYIYAMKKYQLYVEFLQIRENENKSNVNKSLKDLFKVAMKNRVINVPMDEPDKKYSVHLMEL